LVVFLRVSLDFQIRLHSGVEELVDDVDHISTSNIFEDMNAISKAFNSFNPIQQYIEANFRRSSDPTDVGSEVALFRSASLNSNISKERKTGSERTNVGRRSSAIPQMGAMTDVPKEAPAPSLTFVSLSIRAARVMAACTEFESSETCGQDIAEELTNKSITSSCLILF
jgi:hypothetical protein